MDHLVMDHLVYVSVSVKKRNRFNNYFFYCHTFGELWYDVLAWLDVHSVFHNDTHPQVQQFERLFSSHKKVRKNYKLFGYHVCGRFGRLGIIVFFIHQEHFHLIH